MSNLDRFLECFSGWIEKKETEMLLITILSMRNVSKVCTLRPPKSSRKRTSFCVKILSDNSPFGPQFPKYRKIMLTFHTKLSFCAGRSKLYIPVINLIISGWSFSDWYVATVIVLAKAHFAVTIALYEILSLYRLFNKFKIRSIFISLVAPINNFHCLIYMLYLVLVLSRNDAFNILKVVSLLP